MLFSFTFLAASNIEDIKILNKLSSFNRSFNQKEYNQMANFFDFPVTINLFNETLLAINKKKIIKIYKDARKNQPKKYQRSDFKEMSVKLLSENIAIVNTMYSEYDKNNNSYFTGSALYTLRKIEDEWRIISYTPYKPYNFFNFK